jgi:hypothetical protein
MASPKIVGLVSSGEGGVGSAGFFSLITAATVNQIEAWIAQDQAATATPLRVEDITTGQPITPVAQSYAGPVSGLQQQFMDITPDNLGITATAPNWFIASGAGNDAIR